MTDRGRNICRGEVTGQSKELPVITEKPRHVTDKGEGYVFHVSRERS